MGVLRDSQKSLSVGKTHVPPCGLSVSVSAFLRYLLIFPYTSVSIVHSYRTNIHLDIINMTITITIMITVIYNYLEGYASIQSWSSTSLRVTVNQRHQVVDRQITIIV